MVEKKQGPTIADSNDHSAIYIDQTEHRLKPLWSALFNLGLASFIGVIAAVVAFASTGDLRDGSTFIAVPIGIAVWFAGDILRWRGRYPMRLFLMVPIFVALMCTVSIRFLQKANQRRIAWNSMIEAGANVSFGTQEVNGWVQYDEGVFLPKFLETWLGSAVFANQEAVAMPVVAFTEDSPESRVIRKMNFERSPMFDLEIADGSRNTSKLGLEAFSNMVNSNRVSHLQVKLFEPSEETIQALQAPATYWKRNEQTNRNGLPVNPANRRKSSCSGECSTSKKPLGKSALHSPNAKTTTARESAKKWNRCPRVGLGGILCFERIALTIRQGGR